MGAVENGVLTPEQQQKFDGFVKDIVELRESYDFKHWRSVDPDFIGARILHRFGVEPAPCKCVEPPNPDVAVAGSVPDSMDTVSEANPPTVAENGAPSEELPPTIDPAASFEPGAVQAISTADNEAADELTVMAEKLAGVIADASTLMDDLLEALGG